MDNINSLIPQNKFDNMNIHKLEQLSDIEIKPIIRELLEWLQDYNWPIAKEILPIIIYHQNVSMPHIIDVLESNDIMWQYWIIDLVIPNLLSSNKKTLRKYLERLAALNDNDEDTLVIVEKSKWCLNFYYTVQ